MATRTRKTVTRRDAEIVLDRVRKLFGVTSFDQYGPEIRERFDWSDTYPMAIAWEGGPYEWSVLASMGGRDEWGRDYGDGVEAPKGLFLEPINHWSLGIYIA